MKIGRIEVTGVPLEALVRAAYNPSRPQGLGFMHFQEGDLTDAEVAEIIDREKNSKYMAVSMDYVKGRSCKFRVSREGDRLFIGNTWYDHSTSQLEELLSAVGLSPDLVKKARDEEKVYHDACVEKALEYLKKNAGSVKLSYDEVKDDETDLGLFVAEDRGLTTMKYVDGCQVWSLKEAKAA